MSHNKLILPPGVAQPTQVADKYMPHLKHVHEYMQEAPLDQSERVAILMIATVAAIKDLATEVTRGRSEVIEAATADFRRKLRRYM